MSCKYREVKFPEIKSTRKDSSFKYKLNFNIYHVSINQCCFMTVTKSYNCVID